MKRKNSKQVIQVLCGASSRGWQKHCKYYKADTDEFGERCAYSDCEYCNFTPPLYEPVKPEDVKNGWYWSVDPAGKKTVDRIVWKYIVGGAQDVHVNDLAEAGFTFFRIPELPELEVPE